MRLVVMRERERKKTDRQTDRIISIDYPLTAVYLIGVYT